jgi:hypothetical protein
MSRKQNLDIGRSGQLVVMAEFLFRGYNAAIPEVDVGEDVFVVRDSDGDLTRIQVKSAVAKGKWSVSGTFKVPLVQLERVHKPELVYVFVLRHLDAWREFLVIPRKALWDLYENSNLGQEVETDLILYLTYTESDVRCRGVSLQAYRNNWSAWPPIRH